MNTFRIRYEYAPGRAQFIYHVGEVTSLSGDEITVFYRGRTRTLPAFDVQRSGTLGAVKTVDVEPTGKRHVVLGSPRMWSGTISINQTFRLYDESGLEVARFVDGDNGPGLIALRPARLQEGDLALMVKAIQKCENASRMEGNLRHLWENPRMVAIDWMA